MLPEERRRQVIDYLTSNGSVNVPDLCSTLGVSPATVRRDLRTLETRGLLQRTHGGAVVPHASTAYEPLLVDKRERCIAEKQAIASCAAELVQDGEVIILDSGSTTLHLALRLKAKRGLTIITTDLKIALELADVPGFEVIVTGGKVRPHLYSLVGPFSNGPLHQLHANHAFVGADALDLRAGLTNANLEEAETKRLLIASANHRVLIADHTKFGRISLAKVADLAEFDVTISDTNLHEDLAASYREALPLLTLAQMEA
jgi:DeoR/GlpR family transcriptional regulator of sugar metabolism